MRRKLWSLITALALCMGLAVPTLAADGYEEITVEYMNAFGTAMMGKVTIDQAKQYANDSYINAWSDPETGKYGIATSVDNYIPWEDALNIATKAIGLMTSDTIADAIQEKFTTKKETMIYNAYVSLSYFENGWPEEMTRQDITRLAGKEKIKQTHVLWERYSVGNH